MYSVNIMVLDKETEELNIPTVDDIINTYRQIIEETGGEYGVLNYGDIDFLVDFLHSQVFDMHIDDLFYLGALIIRGIISGHPFVDGNKRTGIEVTDIFLRMNGYYLEMDINGTIDFTLSVAKGEMDIINIQQWLSANSKKL